MKVRVLTGIGIFLVALPIILLSDYIVYPIALGLLCLMACFELLRVFGLHKKWVVSVPSYILTLCAPIFASNMFKYDGGQITYILILALAIFGFLIYLAGVSVLSGGKISFKLMSAVFTTVCYITVSFTSMSLIRYMAGGVYFFAITFIVAWMCDTFAYFTGRLFGKHKLSPELSPKKTVEGSLGGMLFAVICCLLYGYIIELTCGVNANYLVLFLIGLFGSVITQIGDLFASLIKREYGIKDYSKLLPGHGGIMDRFDSILALSAPLMAVCLLVPPFTLA